MKTRATVFLSLSIAVVLGANGAFQTPDAAYAVEKEFTSQPQESKPPKPEAEKAYYEVCKDECNVRFQWCLQSNVSTDKFELCGEAHEKCLKICMSN